MLDVTGPDAEPEAIRRAYLLAKRVKDDIETMPLEAVSGSMPRVMQRRSMRC